MAKNNHLYTVYHSLDNKGAFDQPNVSNGANSDPNDITGKYWQEKTEWPKYLHAKGRPSIIVANADEEASVLRAWAEESALKQQTAEIHAKNEAEMGRKQLEDKARKLGVKFDGRTSDKKLAYLIEETEQTNEAKSA